MCSAASVIEVALYIAVAGIALAAAAFSNGGREDK